MTMVGVGILLAALALAAWLYLALFHGGFWRADQRLSAPAHAPGTWPEVVAVVPARDEAEVVGRAVASLAAQDYPGRFAMVLVDDRSSDGTADVARRAAASAGAAGRLDVITGAPLPAGWAGKVWALAQGLDRATASHPGARYFLLTDADVAHAPDALRQLVAKAEADGLDLVSLMVLLQCARFWERLLIPAFVFFFQKLYPFPRVNDPGGGMAGAAGGCMLVRRAALDRIGGLAAIRGAVIDDCTLARAVKSGGPIWLGLTERAHSLRPYDGLDGIWRMVARSAFTQLGHSWWLLAGTVPGMLLLYLVPPAASVAGAVTGTWWLLGPGLAGWLLMARCYGPTLRLYRRPRWETVLLPVAGLLYTLMTIDSARRHRRGEGSAWKGRSYPAAAGDN